MTRRGSKRRATGLVVAIVALSAVVAVPAAAWGQIGPEGPGNDAREERSSITISGDTEFNPANGVRGGAGTRQRPFVISGWDVPQMVIRDTGAPVIIRNNNIDLLVLNWNGRHVRLVNNTIGDLRVNQNVERTGAATSGRFVNNEIGVVQQLRHFDGVFAHNTIGDPNSMDLFNTPRAVNFDGFNGARFQHNTIYGYMDATLHGHHHSSSFGKTSHYHGMPEEHDHDKPEQRASAGSSKEEKLPRSGIHGHRFHKVTISNNKIYSLNQWALRYTDQNHSANDRTATSETNEALNGMHVHHTRVQILGNKLYGAGIFIDVFNAEDDHHKRIAAGAVKVRKNQITLERDTLDYGSRWGILVQRAQQVKLDVSRNMIQAKTETLDDVTQRRTDDAGIFMNEVEGSRITVSGNEVKDFVFGVRAANFTETTRWAVGDLKTTRVQYPVYYDNTVKNHPRRY